MPRRRPLSSTMHHVEAMRLATAENLTLADATDRVAARIAKEEHDRRMARLHAKGWHE